MYNIVRRNTVLFYKSNKFNQNKRIYLLELFNLLLKLSAVRKVPETIMFQALGIIETLGSIISHGTSSKFADVRTHLRKVFKRSFSPI